MVLAGPGVVLAATRSTGCGRSPTRASLGVLNTWGAKGVFDWRSPHHLATVGLQAWDFERGGLADADLIIATGLDEREVLGRLAAGAGGRRAAVVARARWPSASQPREREIAVPPLRADLAAHHPGGLGARPTAPLPPTKVTQHYSQVLGDGGLVAADPGHGRLLGRPHLRDAAARRRPGHRRPRRTRASRSPARRWPASPIPTARCWRWSTSSTSPTAAGARDRRPPRRSPCPSRCGPTTATPLDADAHEARLRAPRRATAVRPPIATDPAQLDEMLAVAGPIVAWTR